MYATAGHHQQNPIPQRLTHQAALLPTTGRDTNRLINQNESALPSKPLHEIDIFHETQIGKAAEFVEDRFANKDRLIPVGHLPPTDSNGIPPFQQPIANTLGVNGLTKTSAHRMRIVEDCSNRTERATG